MRLRGASRIDQLSLLVFCITLLVGARLFYLQVLRYPHYRSLQSRQVVTKQPVPARRGRILDRHGRPLAFDIVGWNVSVVKKRFRAADLAVLGETLRESPQSLRAKLAAGQRFVTVRRGVTLTPAGVRRLSALPGVCLEKRSYRQYPFGTLAAQALGFTDAGGSGREGVEKTYDSVLSGRPGEVVLLKDEDGDPLALRSRRQPVDGADLQLTLDIDLQMIVDAELRRSVQRYGARGGCVLVLDPHAGEILAVASAPSPPDRDAAYDPASWRNRAVSDLFEPGSTLKPLTAAAALRRGIVNTNTILYAERGAMSFGAAGVVHDSHESGDGWLTFAQAFAKSSNICFAKIARAIPPGELYDELRAFGFGSLTGVALPGEVAGSLSVPRQWSGRTRLCLGYGHEIGVTAMQLAGLYTAIANGGRLVQPILASRVLDPDGGTRERFAPREIRRVLGAELADDLRALCRLVVDEGTGDAARVDGVLAAGKTGTAQKAENGRYTSRYVASFGGFVPADDPRLVCLVVLDEPRGPYHWGGQSAAPTFRRIVEAVLRGTRYLEPRADRVQLVRGDGLQADDSTLDVPTRIVSLRPAAMPDLRGQRPQVASRWLGRIGIEVRVEGHGVVAAQWPAPGAHLERGDVAKLRCRPPRDAPRRAGL
jgi:cell division protein FtsI (penicillin-binding protein 3)